MDNNFNCIIHIIKQGDTLYSISRRHNIPLALLLRANPFVEIYNLQIGDELCIPVLEPFMTNNMVTYIVEEGDTLQSIMDKNGIEPEDILNNNKFNSIFLKPGTSISIPTFRE